MKTIFKTHFFTILLGVMMILSSCTSKKYDVLIVTGQNNHNWEASSEAMQKIYENSDLYSVTTIVSPKKGDDMSAFSPDFKAYDVVLLDYNGDAWPEKTQKNFEEYVNNGGGVVAIHAADNSFPEWKEYNKMIGIGGWGNRTEKDGPYVRWQNGKVIKDNSPGKGGMHGKKGTFVVDTRQPEHPIMKGLPLRSMHTYDELYGKLRGPAENMEVLATALSDKKMNGSGYHEPVLMTINYGKGRIFHNVLGHAGKDGDQIAFKSAFFIYSLLRGTEWAATGNVTQAVPEDLPNMSTPLVLPAYKPYTLEGLFLNARKYKVGESNRYLSLISERIRNHSGDAEYYADIEGRMIQMLSSDDCNPDAKNYICRELSWMGSNKCIAVLETLSKMPETSEMANYALSRLTQNN